MEYEKSGIPFYWIVDPVDGLIMVFELLADRYSLIQKISVSDSNTGLLPPFETKFDVMQLSDYLE